VVVIPSVVSSLGGGDVANSSVARFLDITQSSTAQSYATRQDLASQWLQLYLEGPVVGEGLFTFEGRPDLGIDGAHDTYILVLGETGPLIFLAYVGLLVYGIRLARRAPPGLDRLTVYLMWAAYLLEGLASHNQIDGLAGILCIAVLFTLPFALGRSSGLGSISAADSSPPSLPARRQVGEGAMRDMALHPPSRLGRP